ncbi:MAG: rhomboid family intramembrane serine protease [Planctomycetes bacterium]|nr:rhomboid family intramembrane serine protease [Planctomycetota bacterium]
MAHARTVRGRLTMLLVPLAIETPDGEVPQTSTPVVWTWLALVLALFVLERVVTLDHDLALGWFPQGLFAGVTFTVASSSLYGDPALFDLWQLWSHLLVHPSWWLLALEIVLMVTIGRALERVVGTALFLAAIGCLAPLGGVLQVLVGHQPVFAGGFPLMVGLSGLLLGRLPAASLRWGLVWWVVVAVGCWPWFRMPVHTLLILLLVLVLTVTPAPDVLTTLLATVVVAGTGFGLGTLMRRRIAPVRG